MREMTRLEHEFLIKSWATYALNIAKRDRFAHIENEKDGSDLSERALFSPDPSTMV
jgi:hypothetical protein